MYTGSWLEFVISKVAVIEIDEDAYTYILVNFEQKKLQVYYCRTSAKRVVSVLRTKKYRAAAALKIEYFKAII